MMLFNKLNTRLFSLLLIFSLISALAPTITVGAADDNLVYTTDFSDLSNVSVITTASGSFTTGSGAINRMFAYNPNNVDVPGTPGTGTLSIEKDPKYGNVLTVTKAASWWKNGFGVGLQPAAFEKSKNLVIETAIKRTELSGAALYLNMQGKSDGDSAYDSTKGFELVRFEKNGDLNVNKDVTLATVTKAGTYETDTWYELKMEYSPSTKFACITINGGIYENVMLYCDEMSGNQAYRIDIGFDKTGAVAANAADFSLGYLNVYYTEPKSIDTINFNNQISFESLPLTDTFSGYSGHTALGFSMASSRRPYFGIVDGGDSHARALRAKSPSTASAVASQQIEYHFKEPYYKTVTSGCFVIEFAAKMDEGMSVMPIAYSTNRLPSNIARVEYTVAQGTTYDTLTVQKDTWYNFVYVIDIDGGTCSFTVYDPANPSQSFTRNQSIEGSGGFHRFDLVHSGPQSDDVCYAYYDDILIYTEPSSFGIAKSTPANGAVDVSYTDEIMLKFNHELDVDSAVLGSMVSLTSSVSVPSYDVTLMPCGRSVLIALDSPLDYNETYTVGISGIADSAGNIMNNSKAVSFTMADFVTVTAPVFKNSSGKKLSSLTSGEVTASLSVRFNDNNVHPVLMFYGIYSKPDKTLCLAKTKALADVASAPFELTLTVPSEGEYYAEISLLDTYTGLKPYVKKFRLE